LTCRFAIIKQKKKEREKAAPRKTNFTQLRHTMGKNKGEAAHARKKKTRISAPQNREEDPNAF